MPAESHPIYHRPNLHCAKCHKPLIFPKRRQDNETAIKEGHAVLAECLACGIAIQVPPEMFSPSKHTNCPTTEARPWPAIT